MKFTTVSQLRKSLTDKKTASVYFIGGEETFLLDDCLNRIEKTINTDSLNREVFQATDCSGEDIVNAAQTLPFLTNKRVVIVKMANKLKNTDYERIVALVENPVDTACLIFLFPEKLKNSSSKRKDLISLCEKSPKCFCVDCVKMYEKDLRVFIQEEFRNRGKTVGFDVVSQMINESGMDLLNLSNEIEKISVYIGKDKNTVTTEDFIKISGFTKEINIFMLTNAIEEKNLQYALFILEKMLQSGEKALGILSNISTTVKKLLTVKSLIEEKHYKEQEALNFIRVHPYYHRKYLANLSKYNFEHLKLCIPEILKADISIKTGQTDDASAVENLVLFICK